MGAYNREVGRKQIEWPTVGVAAAVAGGFAAVLAGHERVPTAIVVVALAVLGGWYNSLQHEVIHEHPTPWRRVNTALAIVPLGLVVRFPDYRDSHIAHHRSPDLTNPERDPESFYVSSATWERCGPARRTLLHVQRTLAGRLVLGPFLFAMRHWRDGFGPMRTPAGVARMIAHVAGVVVVLLVVRLSGLPLWVYVVGVSWGGGALSLLRSFAEHRPVDQGTRSAVVRSGWFFSLLYLNNNLHHTHHARPWVPWFELPAAHAASGGDAIAAAGAGLYHGYGELLRRYLVRPLDGPVDTSVAGSTATAPSAGLASLPIELTALPIELAALPIELDGAMERSG